MLDGVKYVTLDIRRPSDEYRVSIDLFSHYTGISDDSGNGKTHFLDYVRSHRFDGVLEFDIPDGFDLSFAFDEATLMTAINQSTRQIIFVDEPNVCLVYEHMRQINKSEHLFIFVSRGHLFGSSYPIHGMYSLIEEEDLVFRITRVKEFPLCTKINNDIVVATESKENKSEHRLLQRFIPNVIGLDSGCNIAKYIETAEQDTLIFCDLGNIGFEYYNICTALENCKYKIWFYDYSCYEELLFVSQVYNGDNSSVDPFSRMSIEKVFESSLKHLSRHTEYEYDHKKCTYPIALDKCSAEQLFDSYCGKVLLEYLHNNENSINKTVTKKIDLF